VVAGWIRRHISHGLTRNIWLGLLVHNEAGRLGQRLDRFGLDAADEFLARRDIMDQTNDLACRPYLSQLSAVA